jgi:hypothetical protein
LPYVGRACSRKPQASLQISKKSVDPRIMRSAVIQSVAALVLGLFVRQWRGFSMLDPFFFIPFACLSAVLAGPIVVDLRRKQPVIPALRHAAEAALRSVFSIALATVASIAALNYPWTDSWLLPEWTTAVEAALLSVAGALAAASLTAMLTAKMSPGAVKWLFRTLVLMGVIAWRAIPAAWSNQAIITTMEWGLATTMFSLGLALLTVDAGLLYLLSRRQS